ncbi:MAG: cupin domain-containing protein [Chloroflexi bacterium]|nr:cupin domain-containing protein [Chloroflexota bacterium]
MSLIRRLNRPSEETEATTTQSAGVHQGVTFSQLYMGSVARYGEGKHGQVATRSLAIARDEYAPGEVGFTVPHSHTDMEQAYYIVSGEALVKVGDEEARVGAGTAVYLPLHVEHSFKNVGTDTLKILVIGAELNPQPAGA